MAFCGDFLSHLLKQFKYIYAILLSDFIYNMEHIMNNTLSVIKKFIKKETVFTIAIILGIISCIIVPPTSDFFSYIDFRVLSILFCLMLLVAGLKEQWIFRRLAEKLTAHVKGSMGLELILVLLPFFSSMLITNDVALITFVPFALALLKGAGLEGRIIRVVVLQTIAANLGSMLTPIGNPQNLYLYTLSEMGFGTFLLTMLPLTIVSLVLLLIIVFTGKKTPIEVKFEKADVNISKFKLTIIAILFIISMGTVIRLIPWQISLIIVFISGLIWFRNLFKDIDYFLLGTFIGFFVFVGNMQKLPAINSFINNMVNGHELVGSTIISQVISNVPAAMLLSGFTDNYVALLKGVDIGGLGTLIASMASLISYKFYAVTPNSKKGKYILTFTMWNLLFLAVLLGFEMLIMSK